MSINDINNAAAAMNQLKARYEGFLNDADDQISARQGAYDALAANLKGIVKSEMYFVATIEPDNPNPTNVDNGTFLTINAAISAAPAGSFVDIRLPAGGTYEVLNGITVEYRSIKLSKYGVGDNPIVEFKAYVNGPYNHIPSLSISGGGHISFFGVEVVLPTERADPALEWSAAQAVVAYTPGGIINVSFDRSKLTGGIVGDNTLGLAIGGAGSIVNLGVYLSTLDGNVAAIIGSGAKVISRVSISLENGAQVYTNGTVGVDVIQH